MHIPSCKKRLTCCLWSNKRWWLGLRCFKSQIVICKLTGSRLFCRCNVRPFFFHRLISEVAKPIITLSVVGKLCHMFDSDPDFYFKIWPEIWGSFSPIFSRWKTNFTQLRDLIAESRTGSTGSSFQTRACYITYFLLGLLLKLAGDASKAFLLQAPNKTKTLCLLMYRSYSHVIISSRMIFVVHSNNAIQNCNY